MYGRQIGLVVVLATCALSVWAFVGVASALASGSCPPAPAAVEPAVPSGTGRLVRELRTPIEPHQTPTRKAMTIATTELQPDHASSSHRLDHTHQRCSE